MELVIYFTNGQTATYKEVSIEEGLATLTVHTGPGEKSVVPLVNVLFYDVEEGA